MPMTKEKKANAIKHILETVFLLDPDNNIKKAFKQNNIVSPFDIVSMSNEQIKLLTFEEGAKTLSLPKGQIGKLIAFNAFIMHCHLNKRPMGNEEWEKITKDEFNEFRTGPNFKCWQLNGPPAATKPVDPVCEFKKGI